LPSWAMKIQFKAPLPKYIKSDSVGDAPFGYFCRLCRIHYTGTGVKDEAWVTIPCINMNSQAFSRHQTSLIHADNERVEAQAGQIEVYVNRVVRPNFENLRKQLRTCEYMVKQKAPIAHYEALMELQIQNGAFPSLIGVFRGRHACREMVQCLATAARGALKKRWQQANCISVTLDETTDVAVKSQMIVFYKYVLRGVVYEDEAGLEQLPAGNAHTLTAAILARLEKDGIPLWKVVFIGSDGASVMLGCKNGVQKRLRLLNPEMCGMHCVLHRFSLVASHAAGGCSSMEHFFQNVEALARHYRFSASRCSQLSRIQLDLGQQPAKLIEACFTRWGTHDPLTQCLLENLHAVMQQLRNDTDSPEAQGYFSFLNNEDTIFNLCVVRDILPVLNHFSKVLQGNEIDFENMEVELGIVQDTLHGFIATPGHHVRDYSAVLSEVRERNLAADVREPRVGQKYQMETTRVHFLLALQANLHARFPSISIMKAFVHVLQPQRWNVIPRSTTVARAMQYEIPHEALHVLHEHYKHHQLSDMNYEELSADFVSYVCFCKPRTGKLVEKVTFVYDTENVNWCPAKGFTPMIPISSMCPMGASDLCKEFLKIDALAQTNRVISRLMEIYLAFPLTTVNCERGFSCTKLTKTDLRNSMESDLLDMLVFLSNLPDIKSAEGLPESMYADACDLFAEARPTQYGKLDSDVKERCASLAYTWGKNVTPQDSINEATRWEQCPGAIVDIHPWSGPSSITDCRAAAISIVRATAADKSAAVGAQVPSPMVSDSASTTSLVASKVPAASRLKQAQRSAQPSVSHQYAEPDGLEIFPVEELLGICVKSSNKKPTLFYKVWWKGYAKPLVGCNNSWEPIANLSVPIVEAWNREHTAAYQAAVAEVERLNAKPKQAPTPPQAANIADVAATTSRNSGRAILPNSRYN
jgi:hypothetical protein